MDDTPLSVAVTGASGYIGQKLMQRLEREPGVNQVVALDVRPLSPSFQSPFYHKDITLPIDDILQSHSVNALVHLAFLLRPGHDRGKARRTNVEGAMSVLRSCAQAGVKRLLYLSSTTVYGAHEDNPDLLTEESPLRPVRGFQYGEDKAEVEGLLGRFSQEHPEIATTILRGCVVMGPTASNFISQALTRPVLISLKGYDPPMQFLHEDDLADAMASCLSAGLPGVYNVAGEGSVRWSELTSVSRGRVIALPSPVAYAITEATWRLRLQRESPACGLGFIRYPWVAGTQKIQRELGFRPQYTSAKAVQDFVAGQGSPQGVR